MASANLAPPSINNNLQQQPGVGAPTPQQPAQQPAPAGQQQPQQKEEVPFDLNLLSEEQQRMFINITRGMEEVSSGKGPPSGTDKWFFGSTSEPFKWEKMQALYGDLEEDAARARMFKDQTVANEAAYKSGKIPQDMYEAGKKHINEQYGKNSTDTKRNVENLKNMYKKEAILKYPELWGSTYQDDWQVKGGILSTYLADPTVLLPIGGTFAKAVMVGGMIGGTDSVIHQLYQTGKIDYNQLAVHTAFGAGVGALAMYFGRGMGALMKNKLDKGEKFTVDELDDFINGGDPFVGPYPPGATAAKLGRADKANKNMYGEPSRAGIPGKYPEPVNPGLPRGDFPLPGLDRKFVGPTYPQAKARWESADKAAVVRELNKVVVRNGVMQVEETPILKALWAHERQLANVAHRATIIENTAGARTARLQEKMATAAHKEALSMLRAHEKEMTGKIVRAGTNIEKLEKALAEERGLANWYNKPDKITAGTYYYKGYEVSKQVNTAAGKAAGWEFREIGKLKPIGSGRTMREAFTQVDKIQPAKKVADIPARVTDDMEALEATVANLRHEISEVSKSAKTPAKDLDSYFSEPMYFNAGLTLKGFAEDKLKQALAGAAVGAAAGNAYGDRSMGYLGALAGAVSPWFLPRLFRGVGKLTDAEWIKNARMENAFMASRFSSPETYLRGLNRAWATTAADMFHDAVIKVSQMQGRALAKVSPHLDRIPKEEYDHFVRVMQGIDKPKTKIIMDAAKATNEMFKDYLGKAYRAHVIGKGDYLAMLGKHYWPRIWNESFIATKEGHDQLVKVLAETGFKDGEQMKRIVKHLLHDEETFRPRFITMTNKKGETVHVLTRDSAHKIIMLRAKQSVTSRSTHMDNKRKLHVKDESVLNPFMLQDPKAVVTNYGHDVATRVGFAEKFGPKDQWIKTLIKTHDKDPVDKKAVDYIADMYYTALGDSSSKSVAAALDMSHSAKRVLGSLSAFNTLKLSLAQVLNITQSTVNGLTFASKHGGVSAMKAYAKGIQDIMTAEGREFADRSAAALETTIMELISEGSHTATISGAFGKSTFEGRAAWLNNLNNPAKFLKLVGFMQAEKLNRMLSANMGKALMEETMEKVSKLGKGVMSEADEYTVKRNALYLLDDLGMRRSSVGASKRKYTKEVVDKEWSGVDAANLHDMLVPKNAARQNEILELAGLEFSNRVNHTNSIEALPMWARTPYARLALKFKSFAYYQSKFLKNNVIAPAGQGDLRPLAAYIGLGSSIGMGADQIRRLVASDDREMTMVQNMLRGIGSVGGMGLMMDAINTFVKEPYAGKAYSLMAGPVISDAFTLMRGGYATMAERSGDPMFRAMVKSTAGNYPGKKNIMDWLKEPQY